MSGRMKLNDTITVGPQPGENELKQLTNDGFRSVINFRTEGEEDQPLSPGEERAIVEESGLRYLHVPVSMKSMGHDKVDDFRRQLESLPKPVFAHCKSGKRAGAMMMMHVAVENGMSGEQTLQQAEEMGFECDVPELKEFVKTYVDRHATAGA